MRQKQNLPRPNGFGSCLSTCLVARFWLVVPLILTLVLPLAPQENAFAANRAPATAPQRPDAEKIMRAKALAAEGKVDVATKILSDAIDNEKDRERRALMRMALAVIYFQFGNLPIAGAAASATPLSTNDANAEKQFTLALEDDVRLPDYAHYFLGLLKKKAGRGAEARAAFEKVLGTKTIRPSEIDSRFQLTELLLQEEKWSQARTHLEVLRKNLKGNERYPEVVYSLMRAEHKSGRKTQACNWARELYAKYPTAAQVREWGPVLEKNIFEKSPLGCSASTKDLKNRVRRLWLGGDSERASAELKLLKDETDDEGYSLIDSLTIGHMLSEGRVDEALKSLLAHYEADKNRPGYLLMLAKAASNAGEYQVAVSAYQRAFELAPRGKNGLNSLFHAAFTSYQMQDYDGASRRFEYLLKQNRSSHLAREAQWYIAWIRYLRGDYQGAADQFMAFSKAAPRYVRRKNRRRSVMVATDSAARDRMRYWYAMSLLKMGKQNEAIPVFQGLAVDPSLGYYAILSFYRLQSLPGTPVPLLADIHFGVKRPDANVAATKIPQVGTASLITGASAIAAGPLIPSEAELKAQRAAATEEAAAEYEDETKTAKDDSEAAEDAEKEEGASTEEAETSASSASLPESVATFRDASLALRFERIRDLVLVGLEDGARRELREIEMRVRTVEDKKLLITEFVSVKNFERSSYMAEVGFANARMHGGILGSGRSFWEYAYPRAWDSAVVQASRATAVPEELIWGIMRAESHFRSEARSPVGALGLMQLMPFTGRKVADLLNLKAFDTRTLIEPETNIKLGSRYLQRLVEKFSGKVPLVAGAYNAGPHRVYAWVRNFGSLDMDEFIEHIPYNETRNYVKRVSRNFQIYRLLYGTGGSPAPSMALAGMGSGDNSTSRMHALRWIIQPVGVQLSEPHSMREVW